MRTITLVTYLLLLLLIISCGVPQADFDALKKENEKLQKELAECELTPAELLERANAYYSNADYTKSRERLQVLIAKYANSNEGKKAKKTLKQVENKILETARVNNQEKVADKSEEEEEEDEIVEEEDINNENIENAKKKKKALSKMKKKYDIDTHVTWYTDQSSTKLSTKNYIQAYVGKKEKKPWLGISINYFSKKKQLFLERIEITIDKNTFEIKEDTPGEFKSKKESAGKREWLDRVIKKKDKALIKEIASGKIVKIKFVGKDAVSTRTVSKTEKKAIKNVLDAFVALGGSID